MKTTKSILRFSLILYLCLFLTGATYILTASAKITPNPDMDGTTLITIVKGDTLWHLAAEHLEDPLRWPEFKQYNTFSDPDQIFPDEVMRIPMKMVVEIVEEPDVTLIELEAVKKELEAMEARAMTAEEAVGVTASDVTAIKKKVEDLIAQQKMVEDGLKGVHGQLEQLPEVAAQLNNSLMEHAEASKKAISKVRKEVKSFREDAEGYAEEFNGMAEKNHKKAMKSLKATEDTLAAGIKANAESLEKLHAIERGATEKPNPSKRTLAFLTTLAGTAAWFALSAID